MARRRLTPSEIVERLLEIEALAADGQPVADAIRLTGVLPAEYDQWRAEYEGLLRTLGPLVCARPKRRKRTSPAAPRRPVKAPH
jgi:hypothetical protein